MLELEAGQQIELDDLARKRSPVLMEAVDSLVGDCAILSVPAHFLEAWLEVLHHELACLPTDRLLTCANVRS